MGAPASDMQTYGTETETMTAVMRDGTLMSKEDAAKHDSMDLDDEMALGTGVSHRADHVGEKASADAGIEGC